MFKILPSHITANTIYCDFYISEIKTHTNKIASSFKFWQNRYSKSSSLYLCNLFSCFPDFLVWNLCSFHCLARCPVGFVCFSLRHPAASPAKFCHVAVWCSGLTPVFMCLGDTCQVFTWVSLCVLCGATVSNMKGDVSFYVRSVCVTLLCVMWCFRYRVSVGCWISGKPRWVGTCPRKCQRTINIIAKHAHTHTHTVIQSLALSLFLCFPVWIFSHYSSLLLIACGKTAVSIRPWGPWHGSHAKNPLRSWQRSSSSSCLCREIMCRGSVFLTD